MEGISGDLILHEDSGSKVVRLSLAFANASRKVQSAVPLPSSTFVLLQNATGNKHGKELFIAMEPHTKLLLRVA